MRTTMEINGLGYSQGDQEWPVRQDHRRIARSMLYAPSPWCRKEVSAQSVLEASALSYRWM
jgi:hypothetical protein